MSYRLAVAAVLATLPLSGLARACPFCAAQSQTLSEEIATMDAAVVARLVKPAPPSKGDQIAKAQFEVVDIVRGASGVELGQVIHTIYFGTAEPGSLFLVTAVDPPTLTWSTPMALSKRSAEYVKRLPTLPEQGAERMVFFQKHLEDKEELLARDAYDEFARAPYPTVKAMRDKMDRPQLVKWIRDLEIPANRRRLYLTMLGVCGVPEDLPLLEEMLRSKDRRLKAGLDAMIACYLTLKGPEGMPLIEELFLANQDAEYSDTYAAIMALRFHGTEGGIIPQKRILEGLHHMLSRPALADLVIPDLARWEDWSQVERLTTLFKTADEKSSWVKVPVINYLRACPSPEAQKHLEELKKLDPETFERAQTFFPFGPTSRSEKTEKTESQDAGAADEPAPRPVGNEDTRVERTCRGSIA